MSEPLKRHSFNVTPDDSSDLPKLIELLYVTNGGDIVLELVKDTSPITLQVLSGQFLSGLHIKKIYSTGTTATGIIGFY